MRHNDPLSGCWTAQHLAQWGLPRSILRRQQGFELEKSRGVPHILARSTSCQVLDLFYLSLFFQASASRLLETVFVECFILFTLSSSFAPTQVLIFCRQFWPLCATCWTSQTRSADTTSSSLKNNYFWLHFRFSSEGGRLSNEYPVFDFK